MLGTYDIDENDDTTITDCGVYRIENGELVFDSTVWAPQQTAARLRMWTVDGRAVVYQRLDR